MKEKTKENMSIIAKRRRRFAALIAGVVIGLMPTVEVMAETVEYMLNLNTEKYDPSKTDINKTDDVTWRLTSQEESGSSRKIILVFYDENGNRIGDKASGIVAYSTPEINSIGDCGISELNYWNAGEGEVVGDGTPSNPFVLTAPLRAVLKQSVNVTVNVNPAGAGTTTATKTKAYKNDTVGITATANSGYEFDKWTTQSTNITITDPNSSSTDFFVATVPERPGVNIEVTANFKEKEPEPTEDITITFNYNGGTGDKEKETIKKGSSLSELPDATREGYKLKGWYTRASDGDEVTTKTVFEESTEIFAQWTKEGPTPPDPDEDNITIKFNYNGGSGDKESEIIKKGTSLSKLPKATREGYDLTGWFSKATGGEEITTDTVFEKDSEIFAQWKKSKKDDPDNPDDDDDDDDDDDSDGKNKQVYNPDALDVHYFINGILQPNALIGKQEQSPAAKALFTAAVPQGWQEAFSMSMSLNGQNEYSRKDGTIVLYVPAAYQKSGRQFAFLAMDKNGKVFVLNDLDRLPNLVTVSPKIEGFAYVLISKD